MNILDLNPRDFEFALEELGLSPEEKTSLRGRYAKERTLSGQMLGTFQSATQVPEGRERSEILPMTKPEGMSGLEAIRSGQAKLAVPGSLVGGVEEGLKAATTGEKASLGLEVPIEDLEQAASVGAGLGLSGTVIKPEVKSFRNQVPAGREELDILFDEDFEAIDEDFIPVGKSKLKEQEAPFIDLTQSSVDDAYEQIKRDIQTNFDSAEEGSLTKEVFEPKVKILKHLTKEELLGLANDLPHYNDPVFQEYAANVIEPISDYIGVNKSDLFGLLKQFSPYLPTKEDPVMANLTETKLPYKSPIGIRAAEDAPPRASDPKAEAVGFKDTVYHTSTAPEEFTEFDLGRGFLEGSSRQAQDLLGVHVGTARAAAERNYQAVSRSDSPIGFTMELRARTDKPATKKELAKLVGADPADIFEDSAEELSEVDLSDFIRAYEDKLFDTENELLPENYREIAAVALRRELAKKGFTHIPYINDVEDPGSISFIMLVDRPKGSPAVLRDVNAQFDPNKITDPDLRFAEGGMVQMEKLFEEGGMTDDGMTREPVTGNEVPPGSLAEEVRDDIPAKLSSGEYVVPADVVRFFGVKFFEDLRAQAKEGLSEMDKDGRIGGTPAVEDEELTPEEEQMLREALGAPMQMAEGGVVAEPFDRTQFTLGAQSGFQTRRYFNPTTKEERNISFINGMPMGKIPDGFVPYTEEAAKAAEVKPSEGAPAVTPVQEGGEGRDVAQGKEESKGYADWAAENKEAIMNDPLGFGMNAISNIGEQSKSGGLLGGILGAVAPGLGMAGGLIGGLSSADKIADARVALGVMESQGKKGTPEYASLENAINKAVDKMPALSNLTQSGIIGSGKQKAKALNDLVSGGNIEHDYAKDISASTKAVTQGLAPPPSRPGSFSKAPPSRPGSTAPSAPSGTPSAGPAGGASAGASRGGDDRSAGGFGVDARAKGGLMMKPKKNKTKGKGLAAKG